MFRVKNTMLNYMFILFYIPESLLTLLPRPKEKPYVRLTTVLYPNKNV